MADSVGFKQEDDLVIVALKVPAGTKNRAIDVKFAETSVVATLHGAQPPVRHLGQRYSLLSAG